MKLAYLFSVSTFSIILSLATGFLPSWRCHPESHKPLAARTSRSSSISDYSPWKQRPGESEFAYMKRLQQIASGKEEVVIQNTTTSSQVKRSAYVSIETWNEQTYKKANLTWEERVQFDGQAQGDRFKQNEILRKNLGYFG